MRFHGYQSDASLEIVDVVELTGLEAEQVRALAQ